MPDKNIDLRKAQLELNTKLIDLIDKLTKLVIDNIDTKDMFNIAIHNLNRALTIFDESGLLKISSEILDINSKMLIELGASSSDVARILDERSGSVPLNMEDPSDKGYTRGQKIIKDWMIFIVAMDIGLTKEEVSEKYNSFVMNVNGSMISMKVSPRDKRELFFENIVTFITKNFKQSSATSLVLISSFLTYLGLITQTDIYQPSSTLANTLISLINSLKHYERLVRDNAT